MDLKGDVGEVKTKGRLEGQRLTRREFLRLAAAVAGGSVLNACSSGDRGSTPASGDDVRLVYQDWRTEWFPPMVQEMLEGFHAAHPGIRVFYVPDPENFEQGMLADFQAGTAPDVFQSCCTYGPAWAQMGYSLDLRPYVEADLDQATIDDWDPVQYRSFFLSNGFQYALPKYHGALALYYNKDMFDESGVDYPDGSWDHDDYLEAMRLLTRERGAGAANDVRGSIIDVSWDRIQVHVNAWGGNFVDPDDPTRCLMGQPEAMAAMEWLRARIWDDGVMAVSSPEQGTGTRQAFAGGQAAMTEDGSWALKDILTQARFRVGIAPMPSGPVRRVTLATTDGFGIYAGTPHPEEAWQLMKFLVSPEYGLAMARASFLQPARASLVNEWVGAIREEYPEQTRDLDIAAFADGHVQGYSVVAEVFANMADARRITYEAWDQIYTLGQAPVERMIEAAEAIEAAQPSPG
jgi:multiple sugar transport system substrate-binding protein